MAHKLGKKLLSWDESIDDADQDFWHFLWKDFTEYLTTILDRKNPGGYWKAQVRNFGWRNLDGVKLLQAGDGASFLREILPQTDCHFYIFNYGNGLAIQNFHHDSPVGNEWYYVVPTTARMFAER